MCRAVAETKARSRLFTKALDMQGMKTVIMKRDGTILFSTYNEKNITAVTGHLKKLMESPHSMSAKAFHMTKTTSIPSRRRRPVSWMNPAAFSAWSRIPSRWEAANTASVFPTIPRSRSCIPAVSTP